MLLFFLRLGLFLDCEVPPSSLYWLMEAETPPVTLLGMLLFCLFLAGLVYGLVGMKETDD